MYAHLQLLIPGPSLALSGGNSMNLLLILLLLILTILLLSLYIKRIKHNKELRQTELMRADFFSRTFYQFRTPLTIISGLSRHLQEEKNNSPQNRLTYLTAIERQGRSLSNLVNQLLDVSSLRNDNIPIEKERGNLVTFMEMLAETFSHFAEKKGVEVVFFCEEKEIITDFVPRYLNKILQILFFNAVSNSNEGSRILLVLEKNQLRKKNILIRIINQGNTIDKAQLPHLFEPFSDDSGSHEQVLERIGLALAKQLVLMLHGTISVDSDQSKGTTFTVELPCCRKRSRTHAEWLPENSKYLPIVDKLPIEEDEELFSTGHNENDPRTTILLAEKSRDVALFIRSLFDEGKYNILYTNNGEKALEMANAYIPDIVITVINMPGKNGLELTSALRNSPLLNHIPIIIITVRSTEADQIEGLKCGADAYIRKPFEGIELKLRVEKLLESRSLLKEKYQRTNIAIDRNGTNGNTNLNFLRQVTDIIHREMKNPDFSSKMLADELAISVSQLNKRLNTAIGAPSTTYIIQVKLSYARKILASQNKTIGEVAAACGIIDVNYFSRLFKKHTGVTPTQYQRLPITQNTM